ncbi:MAG: hypothetical protein R3E97_25005 [Candidatus Eisenbacteria bacterium]
MLLDEDPRAVELPARPFLAVLDGPDANIHDCTESHFVLTNIQQLASSADRWLPQFPQLLRPDLGRRGSSQRRGKLEEGLFQRFPEAKVVGLTATPFRGTSNRSPARVIYRYSFTRAMLKGYIKQIVSRNVAPAVISFTYRDEQRRHARRGPAAPRGALVQQGVALAPECSSIAEAVSSAAMPFERRPAFSTRSSRWLVPSTTRAKSGAICGSARYRAREIHSDMAEERPVTRFSATSSSGASTPSCRCRCWGRGFDHPRLSVAAVFRPFRSLAPYIQFVGRIMRVIHQNKPDHPDNRGFVVSHVGLNNDEHWDDFRELDLEDQALLRRWVHGENGDDAGEGIRGTK